MSDDNINPLASLDEGHKFKNQVRVPAPSSTTKRSSNDHSSSLDGVVELCKSEFSSEDEHSPEHEYHELANILNGEVMVAQKHQEQRIMVESIFQGLCGEEKTILSIPCILSSD